MGGEIRARIRFPSLEWFQALCEIVSGDEGYRRIGVCDAIVGIKMSDRGMCFLLRFDALGGVRAEEVGEGEVEGADFWLEMPYEMWKAMLLNIKAKGRADLSHTLATMDLEAPQGLARARHSYKRELFFRCNRSLQYFFDASARLDTEFL